MSAQQENNGGILAMEVYFPTAHVTQKDLEIEYKVSTGKFTKGLGQDTLAFVGDREDINSICLTVVNNLLEKYNIPREKIGRLEVGTESLVDKSKSTKTVLMSLFEEVNNVDIEGTTTINACYGGTAALLNALNWVDSASYDGRYAIVVAADIAVYAEGPARPTSGCGAVAMLIGRDAPLSIDLVTRASYACNQWDFFKPNPHSEYPVVNGKYSQSCYLMAFDSCYRTYIARQKARRNRDVGSKTADHMLFHSPYNKLVQKTVQRMFYLDSLSGHVDMDPLLAKWQDIPTSETYTDRELEEVLKTLAQPLYKSKVAPCCVLSKEVGNTYTAAVYLNLANMVSSFGASLNGKSVTLFSYGSGTMASLFEIRPRTPTSAGASPSETFSLERMQAVLNIDARLAARTHPCTAAQFTKALTSRENAHARAPFIPSYPPTVVSRGTFYLEGVTENHERTYCRRPLDDEAPDFIETDQEHFFTSAQEKEVGMRASVQRNGSFVWPAGKPLIRVVVTGVAAALPNDGNALAKTIPSEFTPGVENIHRIISGENFITPISTEVKDAMLEKNVVLLKKSVDGTIEQVKVSSHVDTINLNASVAESHLSSYGVPASIVNTMDVAVQLAVAAGLEALRDSGIVTGEGDGTTGWVLPEHMQQSTGIVYATSFPALDTAISEVTSYFKTKSPENEDIQRVIGVLRARFQNVVGSSELSEETAKAFDDLALAAAAISNDETSTPAYEFDRKFLFRVLVLGNAQLAQIVQAKGPNMQTNAACAGSTQAVALAHDIIQLGRAERMIVIAGDNGSSDTLMPWVGNGFRALGAASISADVKEASRPFGKDRNGMILGSGGIGMVLESEDAARRRFAATATKASSASSAVALAPRSAFKCRILGSLYSNSAFHGAALDRTHIAEEMERFISTIEREQGITRADIAKNGVYFSHETSTNASPTASCASNELYGLRQVFGDNLKDLVILNTKGFTGHPMGVSFEDVVAVEVLRTGIIPPIANLVEVDPSLGGDLNLSKGGAYPCKFAIRFAAGFGSQIALAMYGAVDT